MTAFALMLAMLVSPFILWFVGFKSAAVFWGIFVLLSTPSMVMVAYYAIRDRAWPRISGGPNIMGFRTRADRR